MGVRRVQRLPTLKNVALKANVSTATASRALSGKPDVSVATGKRVRQAAADLGYIPNALARDLRRRAVRIIGVLISDYANPFYSEVISGINQTVAELGYGAVFTLNNEDQDREIAAIHALLQSRVPGVLVVPCSDDTDAITSTLPNDYPLVLLSRASASGKVAAVLNDDFKGGLLAGTHLLELGHRRVAMVNGPQELTNSKRRVAGLIEAHNRHGVTFDERMVFAGALSMAQGYAIAGELLRRCRPDSIFCYSDYVAMGVIRAVLDSGKAVPGDVSIVGYDDIELGSFLPIPLTTVRHPRHVIGTLATRMLIERIEGGGEDPSGPAQELLVTPELVVRSSTIQRKRGVEAQAAIRTE